VSCAVGRGVVLVVVTQRIEHGRDVSLVQIATLGELLAQVSLRGGEQGYEREAG
jgi:hypothetical protein